MTPKYSAEWWEKVAARPPEATLQPNEPTEGRSADRSDDLVTEPVTSEPSKSTSFAKTR
jgi:hypothetical protein